KGCEGKEGVKTKGSVDKNAVVSGSDQSVFVARPPVKDNRGRPPIGLSPHDRSPHDGACKSSSRQLEQKIESEGTKRATTKGVVGNKAVVTNTKLAQPRAKVNLGRPPRGLSPRGSSPHFGADLACSSSQFPREKQCGGGKGVKAEGIIDTKNVVAGSKPPVAGARPPLTVKLDRPSRGTSPRATE
ncbi:unnamed protein product, partial [Laminaria digitata]